MNLPLILESFSWPPYHIKLYLPDKHALLQRKQRESPDPFPYWAKLWPASLGLCDFLNNHPDLIANKKVVEIAAGLALPSLLAAHFAREVVCSDMAPAPAEVVHQSIAANQSPNIQCITLNWNQLDVKDAGDVLLLSDVNYDEAIFEELLLLLQKCLANGTTVILSTPQRLMAKPFIQQLSRFCILQEEITVERESEIVYVSLLVLKQHQY